MICSACLLRPGRLAWSLDDTQHPGCGRRHALFVARGLSSEANQEMDRTGVAMRKVFVTLLTVVLIAGCATPTTQRIKVDDVAAEIEAKKQRQVALEALVDDQIRLFRVSYPIVTRAHELCGEKTRHTIGAWFANNSAYGPEFKEAAATAYSLSDIVKVMYVIPGSPADRAGLRVGDHPVSINGWAVPVGDGAMKALMDKLSELLVRGDALAMVVQRGGERLSLEIAPEKACDYAVGLNGQDIINAFADGKNVVITRGMLRFAQNDTELGLVVAHELAHNAMGHINAKTTNYVLGSILDIIAAAYGVNTQGAFGNAAAAAYSQDFEAEADYVGLYMMARAGLDFEQAPKFWRRMAAAHPASIRSNHTASHPATPHRFVALEEAVKEIKAKQASGMPLLPELKKKPNAEQPPEEK